MFALMVKVLNADVDTAVCERGLIARRDGGEAGKSEECSGVSIADKLRKRRRFRNAVRIFATGEKGGQRAGKRTQR